MPMINPQQRAMMNDARIMGPVYMLAAALLFTLMNILVKQLGPHFTVWHIGFIRFGGGAVLLVALSGLRANPFKGNNLRLLIIRGCTGTVAFLFFVSAVRLLPISTALVIFYSFPAFAAVFARILYREGIAMVQVGCIGLALAGVGVLFGAPLTGSLTGQIAALVGSLFAGLTVTLIRSLRATNGPAIIYLYFCTAGSLVTLPFFILDPLIPANALEWTFVLGIVLTSVAAQLLMNQGFFFCRGWEGGVLMSSEVVFTAIAGIVLMGDPVGIHFYLGAALIMASVVALSRSGAASPPAD